MEYLLNFIAFEGLRKEGDVFKMDFSGDHEGDLMSLKFSSRKKKKMINGETECENYYAYSLDNENGKDFLKSLKYLDDKIKEEDTRLFVNKAVMGFDKEFKAATYDTIVYPKSSSLVLRELSEQLSDKAGNAVLLPDSFVKLDRADIKFDYAKIEKLPDATKKEVLRAIDKIKEGEGDFRLKVVFSRYRKFITEFLSFNSENDRKVYNSIVGKNVILVDDYRTSGTTIKEMKNLLLKLNPKKITVFVLIDVT